MKYSFFVALTAKLCYSSNPFYVPISVDEIGVGTVSLNLSDHRPITAEIYSGLYTRCNGSQVPVTGLQFDHMRSIEHPISTDVLEHRVERVLNRPSSECFFGIGPGGDLQRVYGSVGIVRGTLSPSGQRFGFLSFGYSESEFVNRFCQTDSVMRIPTETFSWIQREVLIRPSIQIMGQNQTHYYLLNRVQISAGHPNLMTFPYGIAARIIRVLQSSDEEPFELIRFNNCTATRMRLPTIKFAFHSGSITLTPEDYTRDLGDDVCELLINRPRVDDDIPFIAMNPLLLEGINFMSTANEIVLCDSSF